MANLFDQFDAPAEVPQAPPGAAPPETRTEITVRPAPVVNPFDQFDAPPVPPQPDAAGVDWSKYNQPFGELKPASFSPTQQLKYGAQDALMAGGVGSYNAGKLADIAVTGGASVPVLGSALSGADLPYHIGQGQYGRAALDTLGLVPGGLAVKRAIKGMPTIPMADVPKVNLATGEDELKTAVTKSYDAVRNSPVTYYPSILDSITNDARIALTRRGLNPAKAPSTFSVLDAASAPKPRGAIVTPDDLDTLRQQLRGGVPGTQDKLAGGLAIELLDRRAANPLPQHILRGSGPELSDLARNLGDARGNYRSLATAKAVEGKIDTSAIKADITHSGGNLDNTTRQYLASLATTKAGQRAIVGARPEERQAIIDAARGDTTTNALRYGGKLLGGGGGLGQFIASSTGGGVGGTIAHALGADPVTASGIGAASTGATMLAGVGLREAADARTRIAAENVANLIRRNSPEYAKRVAATPPVIDPMAMRRDAITYALMPQVQRTGRDVWNQAFVPYQNQEQP